MVALLRAQVVLKHTDGLPKDNVSNTFWVLSPTGTAPDAQAAAELIRDKYTTDAVPGQHFGDILSGAIRNIGHEIRMTHINIADGSNAGGIDAPPVWTEIFDFVGRVPPDDSMPSEVAMCVSYKNDTDGAVPPARRRGRFYLGPLTDLVKEQVTGRVQIPAGTRTAILRQAVELKAALSGAGFTWVVYSRPFAGRGVIVRPGRADLPAIPARAGTTHNVTSFWIDSAFDTQRRRGEAAVARTVG